MTRIEKPQPPRWAEKVLRWRCPEDQLEEVQGDLEELFDAWVREGGPAKARRLYWLGVLGFLRPVPWRKPVSQSHIRTYHSANSFDMLTNYCKIAWRNLIRHKGYSAINIGGLAVGMAVAMLNGLWIYDELSFNRYHQNYDRIARVMKHGTDNGEHWAGTTLQYPLATELKASYGSYFKHLVMASWVQEYILSSGQAKVSKTGLFIEADAPQMLTLKMLRGSWLGLKDPHSILLSASTAKALFGEEEPMNKRIRINTDLDVKVTGVYEDLPRNTEFHQIQFFAPFDLLVSANEWIKKRAVNDWRDHFLYLYAQIKPSASFREVSDKIKDAELNRINKLEGLQRHVAQHPQIFLHPMSKWHLYGDFEDGVPSRGPVRFVWLVGIIGGFVLLLACINFMNLSTARSFQRAKEVGVRKTLGSAHVQLIGQFFSESFLVVMIAFAGAILLVGLALPWFNDLAGKDMQMPWTQLWFWLFSLLFILITGLLAGSYPALYLSSFQPVKVLKGTFRVGRLAALPRKVLVVMQFSVSITLIICTLIIYKQIVFAKNRPVGYTRDGLITIEMKSDDFHGKNDLLRSELERTGVVAQMSQSMGKVTQVASGNGGFYWRGKDPNLEDSFGTLAVTPEHGKTVGWQFVAGRDFSRELASDSAGMVINEAAATYMGLHQPVGEAVTWKWHRNNEIKHYTILGVIQDMVMDSPYDPVKPTVFYIKGFNGSVNWINIKIKPTVSASEALPKIEAVFKKIIPSAPFDYKFVDQEYALKFAAEERIGKLAGFFSSLAIFISCLGLFGLASFTAEQRTKEIGIRKVLGASVAHLWGLLSADFLRLVLVSFLLAAPLAWYFLSGWLKDYEYRTSLSWWVFALAGGGALLITLLTVSYQAIKTALTNPVNSLRNE